MRIEFATEHLARIGTDDAHRLGLPIAVIKSARIKLAQIRQAPDLRTLRGITSWRLKKLNGQYEGRYSIRVNDQYRIVFELVEDERPPVFRVIVIDDIH